MRVLWLTGALASIALLAGCETYGGAHGKHGPQGGPPAQADGGGPMHGHGMSDHGMRGHRMHGGGMMGASDPAAMQAWLDRAKTEIAITPEQEAAWGGYVAAINANRAVMAEHRSQMPQMAEGGAHLPDRMQTHLTMMSAHLASMQQIQAAAQALYAQLTEEQRSRADRALSMHGRHGGGRRQG